MPSKIVPISQLIDSIVENSSGEKIGTIKDLIFNQKRGLVTHAILSLYGEYKKDGGYFAIPWKIFSQEKKTSSLLLTVKDEKLKLAPKIKHYDFRNFSENGYLLKVFDHFKDDKEE